MSPDNLQKHLDARSQCHDLIDLVLSMTLLAVLFTSVFLMIKTSGKNHSHEIIARCTIHSHKDYNGHRGPDTTSSPLTVTMTTC